ncbi:MAG: hypothetical protein LBE38_02015 [Deltaproteobacteria bacterium]|jgi:hypothetical protein|nr:hypothetical protein [Deltaproteobacteria bacterium]
MPDNNTPPNLYFLLELGLGPNAARDMLGKLMTQKPMLDPYLTPTGLAVLITLESDSRVQALTLDATSGAPLDINPKDKGQGVAGSNLPVGEEKPSPVMGDNNGPNLSLGSASQPKATHPLEAQKERKTSASTSETEKGEEKLQAPPLVFPKGDLLGYFYETIKSVIKDKDPAFRFKLSWLPMGPGDSYSPREFLGPLGLIQYNPNHPKVEDPLDIPACNPPDILSYLPASEGKNGPANFSGTLGPELKVPLGLILSPRRQGEYSLAIEAMADYLTPGPGAPETKGGKTLVIAEGPAILPLAALKFGSGPVTFSFADASAQNSLMELLEINGFLTLEDTVEAINLPLAKLARLHKDDFSETFSLIVTSIAPGELAKHIETLKSWLVPKGRFIATGQSGGSFTSIALKAAFRAQLTLESSVSQEDFISLTIQRSRPRNVLIWDWKPGDWVVELTEDELTVLKEAEEMDTKVSDKESLEDGLYDELEDNYALGLTLDPTVEKG